MSFRRANRGVFDPAPVLSKSTAQADPSRGTDALSQNL